MTSSPGTYLEWQCVSSTKCSPAEFAFLCLARPCKQQQQRVQSSRRSPADSAFLCLAGRRVQTLVDNVTKHGKLRSMSLCCLLPLFNQALWDYRLHHRTEDPQPPDRQLTQLHSAVFVWCITSPLHATQPDCNQIWLCSVFGHASPVSLGYARRDLTLCACICCNSGTWNTASFRFPRRCLQWQRR